MVQGKTKGLQSKSPSNRQKQTNLKKGKKYIAPKKPALVKQAAMQKALSAKIGKSIEAQVATAASSGKLTIMKSAVAERSTSKSKPTKS